MVGLTRHDQKDGCPWAGDEIFGLHWALGTALTNCVSHRRRIRSGTGGEQADPYSLHAGAAAGAGEGILI